MTPSIALLLALGPLGAVVSCAQRLAESAPAPAPLAPTPVAALCATRGALPRAPGPLRITEPTVRVVAPGSHGDAAALRFVYRGDTAEVAALASGQLRRQLGLKLRAADGCNLVYVMWRLAPAPGLEVSIKRNPGEHTADDCGNRGYTKVKPAHGGALPALEPGAPHTLAARITGDELIAQVDDVEVWRGALPAVARDLAGPAGLRTDNVAIDAELLTATAAAPRPIPGCP